MERIDDNGRWESPDGRTWLLVEPSQEWLERPQPEEPEPEPTAEERIAQLEATIAALLED